MASRSSLGTFLKLGLRYSLSHDVSRAEQSHMPLSWFGGPATREIREGVAQPHGTFATAIAKRLTQALRCSLRRRNEILVATLGVIMSIDVRVLGVGMVPFTKPGTSDGRQYRDLAIMCQMLQRNQYSSQRPVLPEVDVL